MIKTSIEKLAKDIGFDIGMSDDIVQSDLINGLCEGLCKIIDNRDFDMQICYIAIKLNSNSHRVIKLLIEHIKLIEEDVKNRNQ